MDRDHPPRKATRRDQDTVVPAGQSHGGDDLISNLPRDLKDKIISLLSTRDAVRTEVLSSLWKGSWGSIQKISVKESEFTHIKPTFGPLTTHQRKHKIRALFVNFITSILSRHQGLIREFDIETEHYPLQPFFLNILEVTQWFDQLAERKELRKVSFILNTPDLYRLPLNLFTRPGFNNLTDLKLSSCRITLPMEFEGFRSMRVLELIGCYIRDQDVDKLVSFCPNLEELVMDYGHRTYHKFMENIKLSGPNLKKLYICGSFATLKLNTPCLLKAHLELSVLDGIEGSPNLLEALFSMPKLEVLGVHRFLLRKITACPLPNHPVMIPKLRVLALDVDLAKGESITRFLLKSTPSLKELKLINRRNFQLKYKSATFWKVRCDDDILLINLYEVELHSYFLHEPELALLKYLLNCAPFLHELSIVIGHVKSATEEEELHDLLQKDAASMNLNITISNCGNY